MQPLDPDEREFAQALRAKPRVSPVAVVLNGMGGSLGFALVHLIVVNSYISTETMVTGLVPLFGIDCTVKILQGLAYVALGAGLGLITGLGIAIASWRRWMVAIGILSVGIGLSVAASAWAASLDWKCQMFTGTL